VCCTFTCGWGRIDKLNAEKTKRVWLGTRQQLTKLNVNFHWSLLHRYSWYHSDCGRSWDLSVLDGHLTMEAHISSVCRTGFFPATPTAVCSPVSDILGHPGLSPSLRSNGLLQLCFCWSRWWTASPVYTERGSPFGLRGSPLRPHHAGSCFIYCTFLLCHYVHNSIVFMIAMFKLFYNTIAACQRPVGPLLSNKCMYVWHCMATRSPASCFQDGGAGVEASIVRGVAPHYLADICVPVAALADERRQRPRSATSGIRMILCASTCIGQGSFAIEGPTTQTSLPASLRSGVIWSRTSFRVLATLNIGPSRSTGAVGTVYRDVRCRLYKCSAEQNWTELNCSMFKNVRSHSLIF